MIYIFTHEDWTEADRSFTSIWREKTEKSSTGSDGPYEGSIN